MKEITNNCYTALIIDPTPLPRIGSAMNRLSKPTIVPLSSGSSSLMYKITELLMHTQKENTCGEDEEGENDDKGDSTIISNVPGPTASDSFADKNGEIHSGNMLIDATCSDAEVKYPTDIEVLHDAVRVSVRVIESLCRITGSSRPKTFDKAARKKFLAVAKKKR